MTDRTSSRAHPRLRRPAATDVAVAGLGWALAAAFWLAAERLPPPRFEPVGPAFVPKAAALVLAGLCLVLLVRATAPGAGATGKADATGGAGWTRAGAAAAAILIYALVMELGWLGFAPASTLFLCLSVVGLARLAALGPWNSARPARLIPWLAAVAAICSASAAGLWWLFTHLLYVRLPQTLWLVEG